MKQDDERIEHQFEADTPAQWSEDGIEFAGGAPVQWSQNDIENSAKSSAQWSEDGIEIASAQQFAEEFPHEDRSWLRRFVQWWRRSRSAPEHPDSDDPLFSTPDSDKEAGSRLFGRSRSKQRRSDFQDDSGLTYEPEVYSNESVKQRNQSDIDDGDFLIGTASHRTHFGSESDFDSLNAATPSDEYHEDDFAILDKESPVKKIDQVFKAEIETGEMPQIEADEYSVGSSTGKTFGYPTDPYAEQASSFNPPEDPQDFQTSDRLDRPNLSETLQNRLEDLVQILENPGLNFSQETESAFSVGESEDLQATYVETPRVNIFSLILTGLRRTIVWILGLPSRALLGSGTIYDLNRSRLEPVLLAIPAVVMLAYVYRTQIYYQTQDRLSQSIEYRRMSRNSINQGDFQSAYIAAKRLCNAAPTSLNRWKLAEVLLQSSSATDRKRGEDLVRALASPENGNLADAHLFLAKAIWNSQNLQVENVPQFVAEVQNHLRAALSTEPNRFDILERLLDLLLVINEPEEVARLVGPRLERWPLGHYYLARVAYIREDRISQQISAGFMVNRYESQPSLIRESTNDRERYLLCLALSGQYSKAEPVFQELLKQHVGEEYVTSWRNRILAIRAMQLIDKEPEEYADVIKEVMQSLEKSPKDKELWNVLTRCADKKTPDSEKYYRHGIDLIRKLEAELDSEGYMIWGNLSRKRNQNEMARALLERSVRLNPANIIAANNLANLLYKLEPKDYKRALELMQGVLKSEPDNAIFLETRGQIYALLGEDKLAIDDLNKSIATFPDVPEIHQTLARVYRRQGQLDLAKSHESRIIELKKKSDNPEAAKPIVRINPK